jgi:hypothetical protein
VTAAARQSAHEAASLERPGETAPQHFRSGWSRLWLLGDETIQRVEQVGLNAHNNLRSLASWLWAAFPFLR